MFSYNISISGLAKDFSTQYRTATQILYPDKQVWKNIVTFDDYNKKVWIVKKLNEMYSKLENIPSVIENLSKDDWEKLFKLIPQIENTEDFIESGGIDENPDDHESFLITPVIEKKIVWDFEKTLDELNLLIEFDWIGWDEGRKIAGKQDFEDKDTITLLKLISAFIRNNRFNDGALADKFQDRSIEKILKQIKKNLVM